MDILFPRRLLSKDLLTSESFNCWDAFGHGTFQRRLLLLCTIATFLANLHGFVFPLIMKDVGYKCKVPAPPPYYNISAVAWRSLFIPKEADGELSRCRRYEHPEEPNGSTTDTIPCGEWEYDDDDEPARTSMVSDWDLVCQRRILVSLMIAVHSFGAFLLTVVAGSLADAIGRLPVLLACVVVLIISTVAGCLCKSFVTFVAVKFVSSGSVTAVMSITVMTVFEVTTHNNRPLHVIFAGTLGLLFSDMWYATVATVKLGWMVKQAFYMFPTVLLLLAFCVVFESPRWLVAKARFNAAEAVMMSAAAINHFPIHYTALTLDKLKTAMVRNAVRLPSIDQDMLSGYSMRRRALILSLSYFSITFSAFIPSFATENQNEPWYTLGSFSLNLLGYAIMDLLITRLSILTVMNVWFAVLGVLQCLLSLTVGAGAGVLSQALVMVAKALFYSGSVLCFVYTLELFPTAIRGTVVCWVFACGRLGAVSATVVLEFQRFGRSDLGHAVAGTLLMASVFAQGGLPHATAVECTKMEYRRASAVSKRSMEYMKKTLDSRLPDTPRSRNSADSSRLLRGPLRRAKESHAVSRIREVTSTVLVVAFIPQRTRCNKKASDQLSPLVTQDSYGGGPTSVILPLVGKFEVDAEFSTTRQTRSLTSAEWQRLNLFVRRYEPLYYRPERMPGGHARSKRSVGAGISGHVNVQLRTSKRALNLRLTPDSSVFHKDLVVESSTEGVIQVDTSHIYSGSVVGEPRSRVFGSLHGGIFEGSINTGSGDSLYVERSEKFFNNSQPFHSVLYSADDVEIPVSPGGGRWCGLHGSTEKWMKDVLRRFRHGSHTERHSHKHGRVGRKLQAVAEASNHDTTDNVAQMAAGSDVDPDMTKGSEGYNGEFEYEDDDDRRDVRYDDAEERGTPANKVGHHHRRRAASASRRVCNLEITVDNTLFERIYKEHESVSFTRQKLIAAVAFMVEKVNRIYGSVNFGGVEDLHFLVQHILLSEPGDCVGSKKKNPFCGKALDAAYALFLVSLERRDDYCLSYRLNYRDFMDGTLGLAWIAGEDVGTGGFCERYRTAIELDPLGDTYMQTKLSLNTGITTLFNYNHYVGMHVASLTLAHEIGHSFGSPVSHPMSLHVSWAKMLSQQPVA
ncbi:hypothetical protein HPB49_015388 [Dermacentor silvarum]|uniref:Uncharacterized protein n=1 Tax=Dermacentor silvarum TaxID=543639 RepID=A0ACB8DE36_DERSI|nr:hypothetical protein HPB49_015388 [Dermacentor silvarum]